MIGSPAQMSAGESGPDTQPATATRRPYRVVFVAAGAAMAGAEHNMVRLSNRLHPDQWKTILVCPADGELAAVCREAGMEVHVLTRPKLLSTSFRVGERLRFPNPIALGWDTSVILLHSVALGRLLGKLRPDLVVTKGMFAHLYGALAARTVGVPCLWHVEDWVSERWFGLFRRLFGSVARVLPTRIVGCADPISRQIPQSIRDRFEIIYNGVDAAAYQPTGDRPLIRAQLGVGPDAVVIGNVARMTPWKGQRYLLEAFAQLAGKHPEARLVFVGSALFESDSFEQALRRRVAELGLAARVQFLGYRRDIKELLGAMDIFAYPSLEKDTGPLSVLEAMASSLPIVGFDIPGVRMFVSRPEQGILAPVADVAKLAYALGTVLKDPLLRCRLGRAARRRVEEAFSLDLHVRKFEEVFNVLIKAGKRHPWRGP